MKKYLIVILVIIFLLLPIENSKANIQSQKVIGHFFYTIEKGDCLWSIAERVYGDGTKYIWICEDNNLMHNCDLIHAGNVLWIPGYFPED